MDHGLPQRQRHRDVWSSRQSSLDLRGRTVPSRRRPVPLTLGHAARAPQAKSRSDVREPSPNDPHAVCSIDRQSASCARRSTSFESLRLLQPVQQARRPGCGADLHTPQ